MGPKLRYPTAAHFMRNFDLGSYALDRHMSSNPEINVSIAAVFLQDILIFRIRVSNMPQTLI